MLGQALSKAFGDKRGIRRYGHAVVPMDEALVDAAVDMSGRPFLAWSVPFARDKIGEMDTELFEEFFRAFAINALLTLHVDLKAGTNAHHVAEACFKAVARALRKAASPTRAAGDAIPSTKGALEDLHRPPDARGRARPSWCARACLGRASLRPALAARPPRLDPGRARRRRRHAARRPRAGPPRRRRPRRWPDRSACSGRTWPLVPRPARLPAAHVVAAPRRGGRARRGC